MPTLRHCNTGRTYYSSPQKNTHPYLYTLFTTIRKIRCLKFHQWYSSSQNHFSFSFYKVWDQSFQYKFLYSIWIISSSSFYKVFLEIISVQFQYLHHYSNSFVIDNIRSQGVGFGEGVSPSQWGMGLVRGLSRIFFGFFASKWCILRASDTWLDSSKKFRQRQTINFSISFKSHFYYSFS